MKTRHKRNEKLYTALNKYIKGKKRLQSIDINELSKCDLECYIPLIKEIINKEKSMDKNKTHYMAWKNARTKFTNEDIVFPNAKIDELRHQQRIIDWKSPEYKAINTQIEKLENQMFTNEDIGNAELFLDTKLHGMAWSEHIISVGDGEPNILDLYPDDVIPYHTYLNLWQNDMFFTCEAIREIALKLRENVFEFFRDEKFYSKSREFERDAFIRTLKESSTPKSRDKKKAIKLLEKIIKDDNAHIKDNPIAKPAFITQADLARKAKISKARVTELKQESKNIQKLLKEHKYWTTNISTLSARQNKINQG